MEILFWTAFGGVTVSWIWESLVVSKLDRKNKNLNTAVDVLLKRLEVVRRDLDVMTNERDNLLSQVIADMDTDLVFDNDEEADAYLAERTRTNLDLSDPEWDDKPLVPSPLTKEEEEWIAQEEEEQEEDFPHRLPEETVKARDELMAGFDTDDASPIPWFKNKEDK